MWTLQDLVAEAASRLAALPPPKNGQVRAVPDDRTIRYYGTLGLLDRPAAMRGRTALYGAKHLAQVVAIKRMQATGKSLADIQALWPSLDDVTLARMSGVQLPTRARTSSRKEFWKREATMSAPAKEPPPAFPSPGTPMMGYVMPANNAKADAVSGVELRIEIAPGTFVTVGVADGVSITAADVHAFRAAAAPLVTELAKRGLAAQAPGTMEEP